MTKIMDLTQRCNDLIKDAVEFTTKCQSHCFITRDKKIQEQLRDELNPRIQACSTLKTEAIEASKESIANALLSVEFIFKAVYNDLSVWIALKEDKCDDAWDHLITAQGFVRCAMKSHSNLTGLENYSRRLHDVERIVFPGQIFVSSALVVKSYTCSICAEEYGECGHVVGRAYMGEMCSKIPKGITSVDHVGVMRESDPQDKRCRAVTSRDGGNDRDTLTWRTVEKEANRKDTVEDATYAMTSIILRANREQGI